MKFLNKEIFYPNEGNDFYESGKTNGGGCMGFGEFYEREKKYYNILFLKKNEKKETILLAHLWRSDLNWDFLIKKIKDAMETQNYPTPQIQYKKSIDYYFKYNEFPDQNFIDYYKSLKILKSDDLILTDEQLLVAKNNFLDGNEAYYYCDILRNKFPKELQGYYIGKMKKISAIPVSEDIDYYGFKEAYERTTNTSFMDTSEMGKLKDKLTDNISDVEKKEIMKTLIEYVEKNFR